MVLAMVAGWRSHAFVHSMLDVAYILVPLLLIHWVLIGVRKRVVGRV
jgi:hypothetical protein